MELKFLEKLKTKKPGFLKKYDYNIDDVIGVKDDERFILYTKRKLIRIYHGNLKSKSLLSTYIPIENAIFYNFELDKSILEKVEIDEYIETKVDEGAAVNEIDKHVIKYKIIDSIKDEKKVMIEAIIVPESFIKNAYKDILEETGYIDYISFPAFAYKALYEEEIIKKANDLFVVFLRDKIFLTFYSEGELLSIETVSGGLDKVYDALKKYKIKNFDEKVFEKLLTKKGLNDIKYTNKEQKVLNIIKNSFSSMVNILNSKIENVISKYNITDIERIFVTSEFGNIEGLQDFISEKIVNIDTFGFEFYEEYNLDRLNVNPFLFLGMLEAHYAYKNEDQSYNYSLDLRKPTLFYRPSGKLLLLFGASVILTGSYPLYLYIQGLNFEKKNDELLAQLNQLKNQNKILKDNISKIEKEGKKVKAEREKYLKQINKTKEFIKSVYEFKYSYIPKSTELVDMVLLMNKDDVYLDSMKYSDGLFELSVFSFRDVNIPKLIDDLVKKGFNVDTDGVEYKKGRYNAVIRIKEWV